MVEINKDTRQDSIAIAEQVVKVHTPYTAGMTISENEASALNQVRKENIRNNLRDTVKKMVEEKKSGAEIQEAVTKYSTEYEFGQAGGGGAVRDPVEKEALSLARSKIEEAIKAKGKKVADFSSKDLNEKAREVLARNPQLMEEAAAIVKSRQSVVGDLDLGSVTEGGGTGQAGQAEAPKSQGQAKK